MCKNDKEGIDVTSTNPQWLNTWHPATHWMPISQDRVVCTLCPRNCKIRPEKIGFCGVRKNVAGELKTLNYGKSVPITCESIETEAVFHYAPGETILSLGNVGCMMRCDFCQNWTTSQSRLVSDRNVVYLTPQGVVDYALKHGIRVLSWTYNDPVVWHEFLMETAWLAQKRGLKNVYKSAFYINAEPIDELLEVMDVFSISIKSMDDDFYRRTTRGRLQPVLEGMMQVYEATKKRSDLHLELSNLCVTGRNDNLTESLKVASWILENMDANVPLHYVRFHPDYMYTHVERTDPAFLEQARRAAMQAGLKYVYVGNVHGTPSSNTYCPTCQTVLVERYGLSATSYLKGGCCPECGEVIPIHLPWGEAKQAKKAVVVPQGVQEHVHEFRGVIRSCHVELAGQEPVYYQFESKDGKVFGELEQMGVDRFMLSSPHPDVECVRFMYVNALPRVFEVYDRAHFPIMAAQETFSCSEDVPPLMDGQRVK